MSKQLDAVVTTRGDSCRCHGRESGRQRDATVLGRRLIDHQAVHVIDARRCSEVYNASTAVVAQRLRLAGAAKPVEENLCSPFSSAAHSCVSDVCFVDTSLEPQEVSLLVLPLQA